ncbi:hypothetical protein JQX13_17145 [Archangium violaceum]|uniref:hypothetical protein n=1 Tax=Archangium violaceum TaxID=83451 RepID=UPI00193C60C1|nr:hypothetical protein [Archangium violaceum]QRK11641.1 hypothetical protein JQX13_17145 [Archangium violaceum]
MKKMSILLAALLLAPAPALAADYKCHGNRVEKSGSTQYTVRTSGADITIEKGGGTRGRAVKRGGGHAVEVGGSTQATIENGRIYKGGSTWATVSDAQRVYDCPDIVAATLWVLAQKGQL